LEGEGVNVLVADDEPRVRLITVTRLSSLGYEISEAQDGQEALDLLEGGYVPDLLITGNWMPRVNGLQLIGMLRQSADPVLSRMPIIMVTARRSEQHLIESLDAGADDYIVKPFSPGELAARVRALLRRSRR
jgi:two-component system, OmpR family, phosphate regulon response regulator PhoB